MPSNSYGDAGSAGGASGSVEFGQATSLRDQMQKATAGTQGPTGEPAAQGGGGPQAAPPQPPPGAGQPDAQGPPQADPQPEGQQPFDISNYPMQFRTTPPAPWRERLQTWAAHPEAGTSLKRLALLANLKRKL